MPPVSREPLLRRYLRFWGPDPRRDVDEELAFHLAMRAEEYRRAGLAPAEAEQEALRRFGSLAIVRDECGEIARKRQARARRAWRLEALRQDVRFALRTLVASRGFAAVVMLTAAIGIAATTTVFSVAYGVLLRPLPYRNADALVRLWSKNPSRGIEFFSVAPAEYADWRERNRVFSGMAAFERQHDATLVRRGGEPEAVEVAAVQPDVFPVLGTGALSGRTLVADDARPGAPAAVVVSHELWATRFGSDSALLGGDLFIDGQRTTVVGIMPPRFMVPGTSARLWTPLSLAMAPPEYGNRYLRVLARLAPGVTLARARADVERVAAEIGRAHPVENGAWTVNLMSVPEMIIGARFRRAVLALLGVVTFVLLIACANVASLLLARASARRRELAVRVAMGATRRRIAAQLLTESALLSAGAGVAGLALAYGGLRVLRALGGPMVPRLEDVRLDAPVLAFTAAVALGSGLLFGLLPALRASRADVGGMLKEGSRATAARGAGAGARAALVVAQVALSLVLLVGAGLLVRSVVRLQAVDVGFEPRALAVVWLRLPEAAYPDDERAARFYDQLLDRTRALPGVTAAAAVSSAPFAGPNTGTVFLPAEQQAERGAPLPDADYRVVTPGYFRTLGIPLVRGRDFDGGDRAGAPAVVVISEAMARRHWPGADPVGRRIRFGASDGVEHTIVGVVGDARYQSLETPDTRPMMYLSATAHPERTMALVLRTRDGASLAPAVRRLVASLDPGLPAPTVEELPALIGQATATYRFALVLFLVFAGAALVLATVGIYGVLAYRVRQRTHELGVRIALGATPASLVASVVGSSLRLALPGVALGVLGALALTRLLASLLFGVSATDPAIFTLVALLLTVLAVLASFVPARRATHTDPVRALRGEA